MVIRQKKRKSDNIYLVKIRKENFKTRFLCQNMKAGQIFFFHVTALAMALNFCLNHILLKRDRNRAIGRRTPLPVPDALNTTESTRGPR